MYINDSDAQGTRTPENVERFRVKAQGAFFVPVSSTKPPHYWRARARDLRKLASLTDAGPVKSAMGVVEDEYGRLARNSDQWRVGTRVARKNGPEVGTIVEAEDRIKVKWDDGRTSYFRRDKPANVKLEDEEKFKLLPRYKWK